MQINCIFYSITSHQEFLSNSHGVWICARLMAIGSPPITWALKNITGEMWVFY